MTALDMRELIRIYNGTDTYYMYSFERRNALFKKIFDSISAKDRN